MTDRVDVEEVSVDSSAVRSLCKHTLIKHIHNRVNHHPPVLFRPHTVAFLPGADIATAEGFWPYSRVQVFSSKNLYRTSFTIGKNSLHAYHSVCLCVCYVVCVVALALVRAINLLILYFSLFIKISIQSGTIY